MKVITKIEELISSPLKVLIVGAEASPFAAVGGFARVIESLSSALVKQGHDVRVFMPKFGFIDEEKYKTTLVLEGLVVPTGDSAIPELICNVKKHKLPNGVTVYFLENMEYYEKRANVYGYSDDPTRWVLLSRGALEFLRNLEQAKDEETRKFKPAIIHCNDWHTGIIPNYLKTIYKDDPKLSDLTTLFTIHNLRFQGLFDPLNISELDFDDGKSEIAPFFSPKLEKQNFMKRGIIYSDAINTVSPTYSREILQPEFGDGLDRLLTEVRGKLFGILNGIDYAQFNPETDRFIERTYNANSLENRVANKIYVQKEFGLPVSETIPLFGFVGRLDPQKGVDLVVEAMAHLIEQFGVQFVQVGGGDNSIVSELKRLKDTYPQNVGLHTLPNFTLPRLLFAGCDVILYPSRFEPCGMAQLEAMRYGAVPIVRKVGGLADSVVNFDPNTGSGTGFVFERFELIAFYGQLVRAVETFRHRDVWRNLQKNGMKQDFSWDRSAKDYIKVYNKALQFHNEKEFMEAGEAALME